MEIAELVGHDSFETLRFAEDDHRLVRRRQLDDGHDIINLP